MSRYFDALNAANRHLPPNGQGNDDAERQAVPAYVEQFDAHWAAHQEPGTPEVVVAPTPVPPQQTVQEPATSAAGTGAQQARSDPAENPGPATTPRLVFDKKARLILHATDPGVLEHYRRLRTKILQQKEAKDFRTLLVSSASPQEGKTVTVVNLGLTLAMLPSFRVLIVDCDLRRGTLDKWLGIEDQPGLSDLLEGSVGLQGVIVRSGDQELYVMPRGKSKIPAAELLQPSILGKHFRRMSENFDLVLIDSPPLNLITDAQLIASSCDAVLLIARAFSTTRKSFEQAARDLNGVRLIGTVLNATMTHQVNHRYGYY